jgi:hypothetical protein
MLTIPSRFPAEWGGDVFVVILLFKRNVTSIFSTVFGCSALHVNFTQYLEPDSEKYPSD